LEEEEIMPMEPEDPERFHHDFLCFVEPDGTRLIEPDGVHYRNLVYFASELNSLPRKEDGTPKKYLVRYDPADMRFLYIYDEKKDRYYRLLLKERPPEPFTLRELENGMRELRKKSYRRLDQDMVLDTICRRREFLRNKVEENMKACKNVAALRLKHKARKRLRTGPSELIQEPESEPNGEAAFDEISSKIILSFEDNGDCRGSDSREKGAEGASA
jgi:putative transposase